MKKKKKCLTTSDYHNFTNNIRDAKITEKNLVNESGFDEKIKNYPENKK